MDRARRLLPLLAAAALSLGLALRALDPAWRRPDRWVVGNWNHPDCLSNHWLLVWVVEQLTQGGSLLHNDRYYWPVGDAPLLAGNGGEGFLYLPFHLAFGWPQGVLWYSVLVLTLNGVAGWSLARAAGGGPWSSLLGAAAVGLSPFLFLELSSGRFTQVSVCWLLWFLAAWLRLLDRPTVPRALGAAALLAVTSFFYWYYGLFGVMAGAVLALVRALHARRWEPGLPWRVFGAFCAAFLGMIGPWAVVFLRGWSQIPGTAETTEFPHPEAMINLPGLVWPFLIREGGTVGAAMALPLFAVGAAGWLLVGLGARRGEGAWRSPAARGLAIVALLFYGLNQGPVSDFAPYSLVYRWVEPLRRFWWPMRHVVVWQPALAALGAVALTAALARLGRPRLELPVVAALLAWAPAALERQRAHPEVSLSSVRLPPKVYPTLATRPGAVLVEPPLTGATASTQQQLVYQLWHRKTLLAGHAMWVDRVRPDAWDAFVAGNSFLAQLQALERGELRGTFRFEAADLQALLDQDVRWFSVNRELFPLALRDLVDAYKGLFDELFGRALDQAQGHWIWDGRRWTGAAEAPIRDFTWPANVVPGGPSQPILGRRPQSTVFGGDRGSAR